MYSLSVNDHVIEGLWPCGCRQNSLRSRKGCEVPRWRRAPDKSIARIDQERRTGIDLVWLAPRPGLEPGTCGLTVRRSPRLFLALHPVVRLSTLGVFLSR